MKHRLLQTDSTWDERTTCPCWTSQLCCLVANMQYRTAFPKKSVVLSADLLTATQTFHEAYIFNDALACFLQRLLFKSRKDCYVKEADG
jgi:hypothetical protein